MGRRPKTIASFEGEDRRESGYYSTPDFVADFLVNRLRELAPTARSVLDPCVGRGELIRPFEASGHEVTGYDIVDRSPTGCGTFEVADFLEVVGGSECTPLFSNPTQPKHDLMIANPPYNCHETDYIRQNKARLIERFGKSTALNMYSLFLRAIIEYAADGAFIALVTHDSFLTAVGHQDLRRYILNHCIIHDLHLCPTALFKQQNADVRTCLLILEKSKGRQKQIQTSNRVASISEFKEKLLTRDFVESSLERITLQHERDNAEFVVGVPPEISDMFSGRRLADIAPCITGISTGNDTIYIRRGPEIGYGIPFYKNPASRRFYAEPDGFLCDDYEAVGRRIPNFMIRNRFMLPKGGLSCSSMGVKFGAAIRPPNTLCGVNPNIIVDGEDKWVLLSYLNSRLCLYLVRGVLIRSNMITAGYAARIPVPEFSNKVREKLQTLSQQGFQSAKEGCNTSSIKNEIDQTIEDALIISHHVRELLSVFDNDPTRLS